MTNQKQANDSFTIDPDAVEAALDLGVSGAKMLGRGAGVLGRGIGAAGRAVGERMGWIQPKPWHQKAKENIGEHIANAVDMAHEYGPAALGIGAVGAGAAGLMAIPPMLRRAATRRAARKTEAYNTLPDDKKHLMTGMHFTHENPYAASGLGAMAGGAVGGVGLPIANVEVSRPAGIMLGQDVAAGKRQGVGGAFSYRHPFLGSVGSRIAPGWLTPNRYVAGQGIADRAMERNSFLARHPAAGAYFGQAIPFMGSPYAHAAGLIEHQRAMEEGKPQ